MIAELPIAADHVAFAGHFPGFPVLPGAVLLDEALHEIAQSRGLDLAQWQVGSVKFQGMVRPGDVVSLEHSLRNETTIHFAASNQRGAVAAGVLTSMPRPSSDAHGP